MPDRRSSGQDAEEKLRSVGGRAAVPLGLGLFALGVAGYRMAGSPEAGVVDIYRSGESVRLKLAPGDVARHAVASLLLHNELAGLAVYADDEGDLYRVSAAWLIDNTSPADAVLTARGAGFRPELAGSLRRITSAIRPQFREVTSDPVISILQWERDGMRPTAGVGVP